MYKNVFFWRPQATKYQFFLVAIFFIKLMKKIHGEATEVLSSTFSDRVRRKLTGFLYSLIQLKFDTFCTSYDV